MKQLTMVAAILLIALQAVGGTFSQAQSSGVPLQYRVRLSPAVVEDPQTIAATLLKTYGGRLVPYAEQGFSGFAILTTPERARLLSLDANVDAVEELAASVSAQSAARPKMQTDVNAAWNSGTYLYDGSGNIRSITSTQHGSEAYAYDGLGRLVSSAVTRHGVSGQQTYGYDAFGNLENVQSNAASCVNGPCSGAPIEIDGETNHLGPVAAYGYDDAGNLVRDGSYTYAYDALNTMTRQNGGGVDRQYLYTSADERIAVYSGGAWQWTLRDLAAQVLREFTSVDTSSSPFPATTDWKWKEDYVYGGGQLLATESSAGRRHLHVDHLGTPRLITDDAGRQVGTNTYYPFGAELSVGTAENPAESHKFTGHERDSVGVDVHTLDYMHARYYSANTGRFLSVDPRLNLDRALYRPQTWNRYAYVENNPLVYTDPTGMNVFKDAWDWAVSLFVREKPENDRARQAQQMADDPSTGVTKAEANSQKASTYRNAAKEGVTTVGAALTEGAVTVVIFKGTGKALNFAEGKLASHFAKHAGEFGYTTAGEYLAGARAVAGEAVAGAEGISTKVRGTDTLIYKAATNEFVVVAKDNVIRTYFKPTEGVTYFLNQ